MIVYSIEFYVSSFTVKILSLELVDLLKRLMKLGLFLFYDVINSESDSIVHKKMSLPEDVK